MSSIEHGSGAAVSAASRPKACAGYFGNPCEFASRVRSLRTRTENTSGLHVSVHALATRHKTSKSALRPQSGSVWLPLCCKDFPLLNLYNALVPFLVHLQKRYQQNTNHAILDYIFQQ
jgi:hypothetical protein